MRTIFLIFILLAFKGDISLAKNHLHYPFRCTKDSIALDNAYMRVLRDGAACTLANTPNFGTRIIVALDKIKFKSNRGTIKINRVELPFF